MRKEQGLTQSLIKGYDSDGVGHWFERTIPPGYTKQDPALIKAEEKPKRTRRTKEQMEADNKG